MDSSLQQAIALTEPLFEPLGDIVYCVKDTVGRYLAVNSAFVERVNLKSKEEIIGKTAKQRRDTIAEYERVGRTDLAAQESAELAVIERYLPRQLSADELEAIVRAVIAETGAQSMREMNVSDFAYILVSI